ncbi:MAG TPA: radical SAM protein [bacterium (Candidatus Stahlbacteria)]|nr:radical SAM protein [Candidatus Stahlbacteria bacterium]
MIKSPSRISPAVRKRVNLVNLGCKVNRYDGECLVRFYYDWGYKLDSQNPDLIIINTCVVTKTAEAKSRKMINRMRRRFPDAELLVTGCLVHNNQEINAITLALPDRQKIIAGRFPLTTRSRYWLKIEDGCDKGCSYCILPQIRGRPFSKPMERIIAEVEHVQVSGFPEIVIVGINIGRFEPGLPELIYELSKVSDLPRIRISSIEPEYISQDLIRSLHTIPFCRHLHISLQHTDDAVLASMNRTRFDIEGLLAHLGYEFPGINIGADIIIGYPTETAEIFEEMVKKIERLPLSYLHVFPFSPRPGTEAHSIQDPVPQVEKRKRVKILKDLSDKKRIEYARSFIGQHLDAVVEKKGGMVYGLTDNYLKVRIRITGRCLKEKIELLPVGVKDGEIIGEVV